MTALADDPSAGRAGRRGFTWLELVVILAIIGVLLGLVVPFVWKTRRAANRMTVL